MIEESPGFNKHRSEFELILQIRCLDFAMVFSKINHVCTFTL